jgi:hypothetical protein
MDPAGAGALIGVSVLVGGYLFYYFCELYSKRKKVRKPKLAKLLEAIPNKSETTPILVRNPSHKKLKEFLPPSSRT